jgi:hypothetical protein
MFVWPPAGSIAKIATAPPCFFARSFCLAQEMTMNPTQIPGNEPDPADMSTDPAVPTPNGQPSEHDLPDDEADRLGNFA